MASLTFKAAAAAVRRFGGPKVFRGAVRRPFSRRLTVARREIQDELKRRGTTGGIARNRKVKRSDKQLNVRVLRPRGRGSRPVFGGFEARGIVAIQETGGRLRPHVIRPRGAKTLLRFETRAGGVAYARQVRHPGARVPRIPTIEKAQKRLARDLPPEITRELVRVFRGIVGV